MFVIQFALCLIVTLLPLLIVIKILFKRRLRFSARSLLVITTLIAIFLVLSILPLLKFRDARKCSVQLLSTGATINEDLNWDEFYTKIGLDPLPKVAHSGTGGVPPWLTSFTKSLDAIPPDETVQNICLSSDKQCRILAENWRRFPSLQSVSITQGVTSKGFQSLQDVLPKFEHLDSVHTNDVLVPPNWYKSLTNIRTLWVWGEGFSRGAPFDKKHLEDIASLSNLEMFMVLGYAFNDQDARTLATSNSIKYVVLRGTAVTQTGESELANEGRVVYRN